MRSFFPISCRSVHICHLNSQVENSFIHSLHSMGNWRNVATTMKQVVKKQKETKEKAKNKRKKKVVLKLNKVM